MNEGKLIDLVFWCSKVQFFMQHVGAQGCVCFAGSDYKGSWHIRAEADTFATALENAYNLLQEKIAEDKAKIQAQAEAFKKREGLA